MTGLSTNSSSSLLEHLENVDGDHIITEIEKDKDSGKITGIITASPTFYNRTMAWLSGSNRDVANAIKDTLKAKHGEEAANFAFSKEKYDKVSSYGVNIRNVRNIYEFAKNPDDLNISLLDRLKEVNGEHIITEIERNASGKLLASQQLLQHFIIEPWHGCLGVIGMLLILLKIL